MVIAQFGTVRAGITTQRNRKLMQCGVFMTKVFLLISKPRREFTHLEVKCALCGDADGVSARDQEFLNPHDLQNALRAAGVSDHESEAPLHVHHTGLPTFIPVSPEVATKLGLIDSKTRGEGPDLQ
ncbi:MAG TPA: hypothetical protein VFB43_03060 [Terracidiphilus sp.]|jgi:hypothetical protein|nr:hypothetical protein [Terracidiphilus sp.]